jgi:hypothetical protein
MPAGFVVAGGGSAEQTADSCNAYGQASGCLSFSFLDSDVDVTAHSAKKVAELFHREFFDVAAQKCRNAWPIDYEQISRLA